MRVPKAKELKKLEGGAPIVRDKGKHGYNWVEGFTAFCNGATLEEVAVVVGCSLEQARYKCSLDEWNPLRARLALVTNTDAKGVELSESAEHRLGVIQKNREANLKVFETMREHLIEKLEALRDGTLKMEKHWNNKGSVVTAVTPPSTGDWVNIATYARTIADGSYRAIGDFTSAEKGNGKQPDMNSLPQAPATVIILPASIGQPREERVLLPSNAQVIDLKDVVVQEADKK